MSSEHIVLVQDFLLPRATSAGMLYAPLLVFTAPTGMRATGTDFASGRQLEVALEPERLLLSAIRPGNGEGFL